MFFAEADEVLSNVAAFDSARDALREKLESEGDEGCVLAAEDIVTGKQIGRAHV